MWRLWHKWFGWDYALLNYGYNHYIKRVISAPNGKKFVYHHRNAYIVGECESWRIVLLT